MLRNFIIVLGALCAVMTAVAAETPIERGSYLVNAVMVCDGCHTPRGQGGLNMERRFSGGSLGWGEPGFTGRRSNITPDPDTRVGGWREDGIKRTLTLGVRPDGGPVG